jgi:hypothetical protein
MPTDAGPLVTNDHEALRKLYPHTHLYRGPFPKGYFRRKDRALETEEGRKLRKRLKRLGLSESWAIRLLKLDLRPFTLKQRVRDLAELQTQIETLTTKLKSLLRKPPNEPVTISVPFADHQHTTPDAPAANFSDPTPPEL